ncbi:cysteine peptidase family C39 domain-containing protein [Mesonia aquimarina]|uniref:hypothetical protein n=1 Tax=Mesonia aquimarina TaxID=1504967 RepID=UPI0013CE6639|nr:hypothetical protein [Mesonia aquimarina]
MPQGERITNRKLMNSLRKTYMEHPEYPGFSAMIDSLSFFEFKNDIEKFTDQQLEFFQGDFIADVLLEDDYRLVFGMKKNRVIKFTTAEGKKYKLPLQEFQQKWSGLVIKLNTVESNSYITRIKNNFLRFWAI